MRKSTARHIAERKLTINKDVNVKVKQLQRQLVKLQFSGRTVSNEFKRIIKELKEVRQHNTTH
jgi:hypothetical protein